MSYPHTHGALNAYHQVGVNAAVADASPHQLIQMLLNGALEKIASAKGHMLRNNHEKGSCISQVISILDGLRDSLNFEMGGDIAENLNQIYEYCQRRLLQANAENDPRLLDEVTALLREIKTAWESIPAQVEDTESAVL